MIGGTVLGYFGIEWAISGAMRVRPLMVLSLGAIIVGIQFLSFRFLAEMLINMAPKLYTIRKKLSNEGFVYLPD